MRSSINFLLVSLIIPLVASQGAKQIRWCSKSKAELDKCLLLQNAIPTVANGSLSAKFSFSCYTDTYGVFDCMKVIKDKKADVMNLDIGLAYQGSQLYEMRPFMSENYNSINEEGARKLTYAANIVKPKGVTLDVNNLAQEKVCFAGVGSAEGWLYPISVLKSRNLIQVTQCNSLVQTMGEFFNKSCSPGAYDTAFNPFGDNAQSTCELCRDQVTSTVYCSYADQYAGNTGALYCLDQNRKKMLANSPSAKAPSMAFVRAGTIDKLVNTDFPLDNYELLCPDKQEDGTYSAPLTEATKCAWGGEIPSRMLMTSMTTPDENIYAYQEFFSKLVDYFGSDTAPGAGTFRLFHPTGMGTSTVVVPDAANATTTTTPAPTSPSLDNPPNVPARDSMFSEQAQQLYYPDRSVIATFFTYISDVYKSSNFQSTLSMAEKCPLPQMRWCVISKDEMTKCEAMKNALDAKKVKPEFNCVLGSSKLNCMELIRDAYADMMTVDAAELYTAGSKFNLVPFVAEFYGDSTNYFAVAIAKKTDRTLLVSNLKYRRTCHSGVGKATGWVIPINLALDTQQIRVYDGHLIYAFSELVARACVPGILNDEYNPQKWNAINLCDICSGGGNDKCQADTRELYYGDGGAFRCLVENGDIAFARHTTIHDYTGSRHAVFWARNRRRDDFQLLCSDGSRAESYDWRKCNLGEIPGSTVVTSAKKTKQQRDNMWQLLRYAQEYYSSDDNPVFKMFESGFERQDLMFTDSAVRLMAIDASNQSYDKWLGRTFSRKVENLIWMGNPGETGLYNHAAPNSAFWNYSLLVVGLFVSYLIPYSE